jgi:hypothetical protein
MRQKKNKKQKKVWNKDIPIQLTFFLKNVNGKRKPCDKSSHLGTTGIVHVPLMANTLYSLLAPTQTSEACSKREHNSETDCVLWRASGAGIMSDEVSMSCDRQRRTAD